MIWHRGKRADVSYQRYHKCVVEFLRRITLFSLRFLVCKYPRWQFILELCWAGQKVSGKAISFAIFFCFIFYGCCNSSSLHFIYCSSDNKLSHKLHWSKHPFTYRQFTVGFASRNRCFIESAEAISCVINPRRASAVLCNE